MLWGGPQLEPYYPPSKPSRKTANTSVKSAEIDPPVYSPSSGTDTESTPPPSAEPETSPELEVKAPQQPPPKPKPRDLTNYDPTISHVVSRTVKHINDLNLQPVKVVEHYLKHVYDTIHDEIKSTWPSLTVGTTNYEYILTVPAIWSDSAKNLMIRAAEAAGYGTHGANFELIGEPEAAAVYTLKQNESSLAVS